MALMFFKESNLSIEMENQSLKYTHNKKNAMKFCMEDVNINNKTQLEKI